MPPPASPCFGCACCAGWTAALATLRDQIRLHRNSELRVDPCTVEGCMVCKDADWQADAPAPHSIRDTPAGEPCQACRCCRLWIPNLEIVRGHARAHVSTEIRAARCTWGDCIVCEEWDG